MRSPQRRAWIHGLGLGDTCNSRCAGSHVHSPKNVGLATALIARAFVIDALWWPSELRHGVHDSRRHVMSTDILSLFVVGSDGAGEERKAERCSVARRLA